jgi:hypothetical protein
MIGPAGAVRTGIRRCPLPDSDPARKDGKRQDISAYGMEGSNMGQVRLGSVTIPLTGIHTILTDRAIAIRLDRKTLTRGI